MGRTCLQKRRSQERHELEINGLCSVLNFYGILELFPVAFCMNLTCLKVGCILWFKKARCANFGQHRSHYFPDRERFQWDFPRNNRHCVRVFFKERLWTTAALSHFAVGKGKTNARIAFEEQIVIFRMIWFPRSAV